MSKPILIASLLLVFIAGTGFGLFVGSAISSAAAPEKITTSSPSTEAAPPEAQASANNLLESRVAELEKELAQRKKDQDALILEDRLALFKKYANDMRSLAIDDNLKVTPIMAEILNLSPQEQQAVEQHLKEIRDETQNIDAAKMILVKQSAGSATYEIPAYAEGKEIKDKLNGLLSADIGAEQTEILMNNSKWYLASQLGEFGEGKTKLEITRTNQDGTPFYNLKVTYLDPSGNPTYGFEQPINENLPIRYKKFMQINPLR